MILEGAPVSIGREAKVTEAGEYRFFAGWRSDPFFFDTMGALNNLQCTGDDFLRREGRMQHRARSTQLCPQFTERMGLWVRTLDGASRGNWVQGGTAVRGQTKLPSLP